MYVELLYVNVNWLTVGRGMRWSPHNGTGKEERRPHNGQPQKERGLAKFFKKMKKVSQKVVVIKKVVL